MHELVSILKYITGRNLLPRAPNEAFKCALFSHVAACLKYIKINNQYIIISIYFIVKM